MRYRLDTNTEGWSQEEFDNKNNHSLVTRVNYDQSSFLFTGDLETDAIETLVAYYSGSGTEPSRRRTNR